MTNYEKIKQMSIDEMAEFMDELPKYCHRFCNSYKDECDNFECEKGHKKWLESEIPAITYEDALNMLNDMEFADKYQGKDEYTTMLLLCKHALNTRIPKKVEHGATKYTDVTCPLCGNVISEATDYCEFCGQALDWSDEAK